jgi:uncharacterized protein YeaO (DUF488 family)
MAKRRPNEIHLKRVYVAPEPGDGRRILVDRLWPRGLSKEAAKIDFWAKALAPSDALRKRVHADPNYPDDLASFAAFEQAYRAEIEKAAATEDGARALVEIRSAMKAGTVTLLFGAKHETRNNATVLRGFLARRA